MNDQEDSVFDVGNEAAVRALPHWLERRTYNVVVGPLEDKRGIPFFGLKYGDEKRGIVIIKDQSLEGQIADVLQDGRNP